MKCQQLSSLIGVMARLPTDQHSISDASDRTFTTSVATDRTTASSNPDLARVFVRLDNGSKIVVPIPQSSSVQDLHTQALRRAARLGVIGALSGTHLRTTGPDPIILFGEDPVIDVLDLTEDNTFSLGSLTSNHATASNLISTNELQAINSTAPSSALAKTSKLQRDAPVYIRWITLEAAMGCSRLAQISADMAIPYDTTLAKLHAIAVQRLCGKVPRGSCTRPSGLNLFLKECRLHTENNFATLRDLGLSGAKHDPLDVFVVELRYEQVRHEYIHHESAGIIQRD
jgi:hypothetical protein